MKISFDEKDLIQREAEECCARLMELGCDSVQIVATAMLDGDCCGRIATGKGNLFARYGAIDDWIHNQRNIDMANELSAATRQEDD